MTQMVNELPWMAFAKNFVGLKEVKGVKHNPTIIRWLESMGTYSNEAKAWWRDDETPWCGLFVGHVLGECGRYVVKEWYRAQEWNDPKHMVKLDKPAYGCLAVFTRNGGGHVGFVVGIDFKGNPIVLGGNQSDMVRIDPISKDRLTGYFWPALHIGKGIAKRMVPSDFRYDLAPTTAGNLSTNEA